VVRGRGHRKATLKKKKFGNGHWRRAPHRHGRWLRQAGGEIGHKRQGSGGGTKEKRQEKGEPGTLVGSRRGRGYSVRKRKAYPQENSGRREEEIREGKERPPNVKKKGTPQSGKDPEKTFYGRRDKGEWTCREVCQGAAGKHAPRNEGGGKKVKGDRSIEKIPPILDINERALNTGKAHRMRGGELITQKTSKSRVSANTQLKEPSKRGLEREKRRNPRPSQKNYAKSFQLRGETLLQFPKGSRNEEFSRKELPLGKPMQGE